MAQDKLYRNLALGFAAYIVIAGLAGIFLLVSGKITARTDPNDTELVARGQTLHLRHCAKCHGENLEGEPNWETKKADGTYPAPPQDRNGHIWEHSDRELFDYVRWGGQANAPRGFKSGMPGYEKKLSKDEIWAILAYIKSRWPDDIRKRQALASFVGGIHSHY
ncbi:MAG: cytochrome c [Proteobacteria bacterium]|nr:cytochrome c [Pseudomonadota bacterium]